MSGFHVERKLDRSSQPRKVAASPGTGRLEGNWMRCSDVITRTSTLQYRELLVISGSTFDPFLMDAGFAMIVIISD